jgi:hypothetical protein
VIHTNNNFAFKNMDASLNYKRTFAKEDQELELSINSSFGNNKKINQPTNNCHCPSSLFYGENKSNNPGKRLENN